MINFSDRVGIESAIFIKWVIPNFDTAYISDYHTPVTFGGNTYTNIGNLLEVSPIQTEIRASNSELSLTLSGIPNNSINTIFNQAIKGSQIELFRGFFDPTTHQLISLAPNANPLLKFKGIVTNYSISDIVEVESLSASTSIVLTCNSIVEILSNKVSGRRTNPSDFPGENSMVRVSALANSNLQFGAPR
jgi:hypothetical protein